MAGFLDDFLMENAPGAQSAYRRNVQRNLLRRIDERSRFAPQQSEESMMPIPQVPEMSEPIASFADPVSSAPQAPVQAPARPQALPKALGGIQGPPGAQTPPGGAAAAPAGPVDPLQAKIDALEKQREEAWAAQDKLMEPPDRTASEAAYRARAQTGSHELALALMARRAGLEPFQAHHLKQAAEARAPMKVAGGTMTETGFIEDPAYQQELRLRRADGRVKNIETALNAATTAQERRRLEQMKIDADKALERERIESRNFIAGLVHGGKGKGEGGEGGYDALPKAATNEEKKAYAAAVSGRTALPQLMREVAANPKAFGMAVGAGETVGGLVGAGNPVPMTAQEQATRARIYHRYSSIINEMIGAAQSQAEITRLRSFIPGPLEDAASIHRKMEGALQEFNATHSLLRQRYQMGAGPTYTEPGKGLPPGWSGGQEGGGGLPPGWTVN